MKRFCRTASGLLMAVAIFTPSFALAQTLPTCVIKAAPSSVFVGNTVTVNWSSTNTEAGTITRIGGVGPSGQLTIQPSTPGELVFVGTFIGPAGTATCQTSVVVNAAATGGTGSASGGSGATYNSSYTTGSYSTGNPYPLDPSKYQTQPSSNQFSGNQQTVTTGSGGVGGVSSFLVPCGWSSSVSRDNGPNNIPGDAASCNICYLGQLIQNIINFLIIISIPLSAGLFAWAGIMLFTSTYKPEGIKKAKGIFKHVVIGLVIALSGYLIVQTLVNALMNPNFFTNGWSWNSLSCTDDRPRSNSVGAIFTNLFLPNGTTITPAGTATTPTGAKGSRGTTICTTSNCSTETIAAAAQRAGISNLSDGTIKALSCIAQTENSGSAAGCSNQNACGVFQITQGNWNSYAPANCRGTSNQSNAECNVATAMVLFQKSGYQPWTGVCRSASGCGNVGYNQQWNPAATTCVNTYDPQTSYRVSIKY